MTLIGGASIAVAYFTTAKILRDQIHQRLTTVATDRQKMLASTLRQYEERATRFARRNRIHQLLAASSRRHDHARRVSARGRELSLERGDHDRRGAGDVGRGRRRSSARLERAGRPGCRLLRAWSELTKARTAAWWYRRGAWAKPSGWCFRRWSATARRLGRVMLLTDFGPIASILMDPNGLGETGEVLVGIGDGEKIRLVLPLRTSSPVTEVPASEFPSLSAGIAGEFGFTHTTDYRGPGRAGGLSAGGLGLQELGLGRQDRLGRGLPARRRAALAAAGIGWSGTGTGLGGVQRDRAPVRATDSPAGQDVGGRRGRRLYRPQRGHVVGRNRRIERGLQPDDGATVALLFEPRRTDHRPHPRARGGPRSARRLLPDLDLAAGSPQYRQDVRFRAQVLHPARLRPGDDLAGGSRCRRDPGGTRHGDDDRPGGADGPVARGR